MGLPGRSCDGTSRTSLPERRPWTPPCPTHRTVRNTSASPTQPPRTTHVAQTTVESRATRLLVLHLDVSSDGSPRPLTEESSAHFGGLMGKAGPGTLRAWPRAPSRGLAQRPLRIRRGTASGPEG